MDFKLNNVTYQLKEVKDYAKHSSNQAYCDYDNCEILIDQDLKQDQKQLFLWHELFHLIFFSIGEFELARNEVLVQSLATQLNQIVEPKIIEFKK